MERGMRCTVAQTVHRVGEKRLTARCIFQATNRVSQVLQARKGSGMIVFHPSHVIIPHTVPFPDHDIFCITASLAAIRSTAQPRL